ncbi:hypothetical protein B0W48_13875 [Pseudoalteromonas aliena]|jgi:hypothetical protein|uniref:Uncharacterized protein n=1 Tax=Pseudoalteromonas aliena TaxID=247523 RepID=A0A1Q2H0B5_9GAMM|nr:MULTISPECIES: hypothetical protein [Pseudoalteromonas]AQQ00802.1 hypothetical protein B0W48_13875 [Pseudoalteromonas aliena]
MTQSTEQNVNQAEQQATQAVEYTDSAVAEQITGYATATPEQAEQVATDAVVNAINVTAAQLQDEAGYCSPEQAEQLATQAVAATEQE